MRVLVLGALGLLGSYIVSYLKKDPWFEVVPVTRQDLECTLETTLHEVQNFAKKWTDRDTWVINAAGLTNKVEADEKLFFKVNGVYSHFWHQVCQSKAWQYVYVSTNGVFSGDASQPYDEQHVPDVTTVYGRSKLAGETGMTIRTSVIGEDERHFRGLIEFAKRHHTLQITGYTDEKWNGITCLTLAEYCSFLMKTNTTWDGPRHVVPPYDVSKYELLKKISETWDLNLKITPILSKQRKNLVLKSTFPSDYQFPRLIDQLIRIKRWGVPNRGPTFRKVMIVGGSGSLGKALIHRWRYRVDEFVIYSRGEHKQWKLQQTFPDLTFHMELGDVKDRQKMYQVLSTCQPDTLIYAAAMKHVDRCENAARQCLDSNCLGFLNVLEAAAELQIQRPCFPLKHILYVSTDKACAPINIYGMSKSIGEHMVQHYSFNHPDRITLVGVRYGNVVNSNGSIIPVLQGQAQDTSRTNFTLTDEKMTRFYMTLDQSVQLIEDALVYGKSGDLWIPQLRSMRILDLFKIFSKRYHRPISIIGIRPGEKIHESLLAHHELSRTKEHVVDHNRLRFVVHRETVNASATDWLYSSSDNLIARDELERILETSRLL